MKMIKKAINVGFALSFVTMGAFAQSLDDAKVAINSEQYDKAKTILNGLVENKPGEGENYFYLGQIYLKTEYPDSAKMVFQKGVEADEKEKLNKVGLGTVALYEGNEAEAKKYFDEVGARVKKKEYPVNLYIGRAYIDAPEPNYDLAIEYLNKAKEANAEDAAISMALGDAYFGKGDNSQAYVGYRDAYDLDNSFLIGKVQLAVITKQSQAYQTAITDLESIAAEHPDFAPTYREIAETNYLWANQQRTQGEYDAKMQDALTAYKKYMDLTDYSVESRMRYADFLILAKDYTTLEEQANELAKDAGANKRILRYLGYAAYNNKNYDESKKALSEFIQSVEKDRVIPRDHMFLGLAGMQLANDTTNGGNVDSAVFNEGLASLKSAVEADSTLADDLHDVGMEFFNNRNYHEAAAVFGIAAQVPSSLNYVFDNFYLGYASYFDYASQMNNEVKPDKGIVENAIKAFDTVIEEAPTTEMAYLYKAKAAYLLEDQENPEGRMVEPYQKFIEVVAEKGPDAETKNKRFLVEAYSVLGAYYTKTEAYEDARQNFRKAVELDPSNEYAQTALQNLQPAAQSDTQPQQ